MSGTGSGMGNGGHNDSFDISWRYYPPQLMFPGYSPQSPMFVNPGVSQCSYKSQISSQGAANARVRFKQAACCTACIK